MNLNETDIELLADYERGSLPKELAAVIEKRLETDEEFMKAHNNLKKVIPIIQEYFYKQEKTNTSPIRQYLSELESTLPEVEDEKEKSTHSLNQQELNTEKKPVLQVLSSMESKVIPLFSSSQLILAAACLLLLIISGIFWMNTGTHYPGQKIFEVYYEPYPNIANPATMGDEGSVSDLSNAYKAYDSKDYANAIPFFEKAWDTKQDPMILFYSGNAYLASGNSNKAIEKFNFLLNNYNNFILKEQTRWDLGLSYLYQGDIEKAKGNFRSLENSDNYKKQVQEIIDKLK